MYLYLIWIFKNYQLALTTPGISPWRASVRKHIRHILNRRRKARRRPQIKQRLYLRTANFGVRFCFKTCDFFATVTPVYYPLGGEWKT
jgi:hypothetical protein